MLDFFFFSIKSTVLGLVVGSEQTASLLGRAVVEEAVAKSRYLPQELSTASFNGSNHPAWLVCSWLFWLWHNQLKRQNDAQWEEEPCYIVGFSPRHGVRIRVGSLGCSCPAQSASAPQYIRVCSPVKAARLKEFNSVLMIMWNGNRAGCVYSALILRIGLRILGALWSAVTTLWPEGDPGFCDRSCGHGQSMQEQGNTRGERGGGEMFGQTTTPQPHPCTTWGGRARGGKKGCEWNVLAFLSVSPPNLL